MIMAYPVVPVGAPDHEIGGDWELPSQVYVVGRVPLLAPELTTARVPLPVPPVLPPEPLVFVFVSGAVVLALQAAMSAIIVAVTGRNRSRMRGFEGESEI
jgi:hypothetical protein